MAKVENRGGPRGKYGASNSDELDLAYIREFWRPKPGWNNGYTDTAVPNNPHYASETIIRLLDEIDRLLALEADREQYLQPRIGDTGKGRSPVEQSQVEAEVEDHWPETRLERPIVTPDQAIDGIGRLPSGRILEAQRQVEAEIEDQWPGALSEPPRDPDGGGLKALRANRTSHPRKGRQL